MTRRIFCKVLLVVVAIFGLLVLSGVLMAQGRSENAFERVRKAQERHTDRLMAMDGVEGTAIGFDQSGQLAVKVFTARHGVAGIAKKLDDVPVHVVVTGKIYALAKGGKSGKPPKPNTEPLAKPPLWCERPVPIGVSTGHPDITAGTIACRVTDGTNVYALSNNHVYANENRASIGDNVLQPGTYDGGVDPDDAIGTLADFEPIVFSRWARNEIDAAIASSSTANLGTATPAGGYGIPSSETATAYVGLAVQKYGRTTGLTTGEITAINATVRVGYSRGTARFVKQIIIEPGDFSAGGDSGSLIVTQDGNYPVGFLFAGSSTLTVANPIDLVLDRFGVTVDNTIGGEPPVLTTIEVSPSSVTLNVGDTQQFTATGSFDDGSTADLTSTATWASSNTAVATVDVSGLATGIEAGTTDITATQDGVTSNTASLEVTAPPPPPTLSSISVTPISATIEEGQTQQFTATGSFDDSSTADLTSTATWASSNTAVATVDASGLATGIEAGTTDITATQDGVTSNTASLEVTAPPPPPTLVSIAVTPETASIQVGSTQQYSATGTYSDASTADITNDVAWTSSKTEVATIDASGLATGVNEGTTIITASSDSITSNEATLSVTAAPGALVAYVTIDMSKQSFWKWWRATSTVTITEGDVPGGSAIDGAIVEGHWSGAYGGNVSGTTKNGQVSFRTGWIREAGMVTFTVDRVVENGQEYTLAGETEDSVSH